jgi:hypothetical protein
MARSSSVVPAGRDRSCLLNIAPLWEIASEKALADAELKLASLLDHLEKDLAKSKD